MIRGKGLVLHEGQRGGDLHEGQRRPSPGRTPRPSGPGCEPAQGRVWHRRQKGLVTFMNNSAARALLGRAEPSQSRTRDVCGGNIRMMCTFMKNSVAAAIAGPNAAPFWAGLSRLKDEFGIRSPILIDLDGASHSHNHRQIVAAVMRGEDIVARKQPLSLTTGCESVGIIASPEEFARRWIGEV
eukprot:scaffold2661_cov120-Isochrysis_galbana.AAC.9